MTLLQRVMLNLIFVIAIIYNYDKMHQGNIEHNWTCRDDFVQSETRFKVKIISQDN